MNLSFLQRLGLLITRTLRNRKENGFVNTWVVGCKWYPLATDSISLLSCESLETSSLTTGARTLTPGTQQAAGQSNTNTIGQTHTNVSKEPSTMSDVNSTLLERGKRYGEFETQAGYSQDIKLVYERSPNWVEMADDQREALELIANKIGRILNGDPN